MSNPFISDGSVIDNLPPAKYKRNAEESDELFRKRIQKEFKEQQFYPANHPQFAIGKCTILGNVPSKSNCYRIVTFKSKDPKKQGYSTLAKTKELKQYEKDFAKQWVNKGMISCDFKFEMDVYFPTKRSDLDNSLKCVLDCLQPADKRRPFGVGAIENDNMAQDIHIRKHIDKANPRIEFVITPINP